MDLGGNEWNWEESGRNWEELSGSGRNREEPGRTRKNWVDLGGTGRKPGVSGWSMVDLS